MGALVALIAPKLLPALIPPWLRTGLAWAAVIAFVVLTAGVGLKVYNGRLRREGRDIERRRQQDAWSQTEARVAAAGAAADARSDDDVRKRLRQRATPAAGSGDPVQRR